MKKVGEFMGTPVMELEDKDIMAPLIIINKSQARYVNSLLEQHAFLKPEEIKKEPAA